MTDWYTASGNPTQGSAGASNVLRSEYNSIAAAFSKMPALTGYGGLLVGVNSSGTALQTYSYAEVFNALNITALNGVTIGATTPSTGAFTTLSASSVVSGTGFSNYLASPPNIGNTTPSTVKGTTVTATSQFSGPGTGLTGTASGLSIGGNATTATTATTATNLASGSAGTVPYQSASGTTAMLAAGTAGQKLVSNGASAPSWGSSIVSGTAQNSTSGTSIDFTGIPSWVKRITVMFNGVSTNGSSLLLVQVGAGSITGLGYVAASSNIQNASSTAVSNSPIGFNIYQNSPPEQLYGTMTISLMGSNVWVASGTFSTSGTVCIINSAGDVGLSGTLDRIRITTVNGTDTFDAGSINILYE